MYSEYQALPESKNDAVSPWSLCIIDFLNWTSLVLSIHECFVSLETTSLQRPQQTRSVSLCIFTFLTQKASEYLHIKPH